MVQQNVSAIVLAAGKGTRMKASLPKVLHSLCGMPLIYYSLDALKSSQSIKKVVVVTGFAKDKVKTEVNNLFKGVTFSVQKRLNGSAKAVEVALPEIKSKQVLIMCADSPLLDRKDINRALRAHIKAGNDCTVLTKRTDVPKGLGRIIRDSNRNLLEIKEQAMLSPAQKKIDEINTGIYVFETEILKKYIKKVRINSRKKEYFLTDIIALLILAKRKVRAVNIGKDCLYFSVNNLRDLIKAERVVRMYLIEKLIDKGVRVIDPETTFLGPKTLVGENSIIYPFTFLENNVKIGSSCSVGPFARVREGTVIRDNSHIGNFAEIVRSKVAENVKMKHFSYLGDTEVESGVNIGCGTVVANFDGKKKNKTKIKKGAFIGSDSILVAPVVIGRDALTGAGSVVTKNVKDKTVVIGVPAKELKVRKNV